MRKILKGLTIFAFFILLAALTPECIKAADYNVTADGVWKIGTVSSGHTDAYSVTLKENGWLTLTARSYTTSGRFQSGIQILPDSAGIRQAIRDKV